MVFILGVGVLLLGAVLMGIQYRRNPGFFNGTGLRKGTSQDAFDDVLTD